MLRDVSRGFQITITKWNKGAGLHSSSALVGAIVLLRSKSLQIFGMLWGGVAQLRISSSCTSFPALSYLSADMKSGHWSMIALSF